MSILDNPTQQPREKITGKHIALIALFFILAMVPFGWAYYQRQQAESAKVEATRMAELQKKTIAAMMVNLPQKPREKKMAVKIARGTTGQADLVETYCEAASGPNGSGWTIVIGGGGQELHEGFGEYWLIDSPESGIDSDNPQGWNVTEDGVITVPSGATAGAQQAFFFSEGGCTPDSPNEANGSATRKRFEFEVICMKVKISPYRRIQ